MLRDFSEKTGVTSENLIANGMMEGLPTATRSRPPSNLAYAATARRAK